MGLKLLIFAGIEGYAHSSTGGEEGYLHIPVCFRLNQGIAPSLASEGSLLLLWAKCQPSPASIPRTTVHFP